MSSNLGRLLSFGRKGLLTFLKVMEKGKRRGEQVNDAKQQIRANVHEREPLVREKVDSRRVLHIFRKYVDVVVMVI